MSDAGPSSAGSQPWLTIAEKYDDLIFTQIPELGLLFTQETPQKATDSERAILRALRALIGLGLRIYIDLKEGNLTSPQPAQQQQQAGPSSTPSPSESPAQPSSQITGRKVGLFTH